MGDPRSLGEMVARQIDAYVAEHGPIDRVLHTVQVTSFGGSGSTALSAHLVAAGVDIPKTPGEFPFKHQRFPPAAADVPEGFRVLYPFADPRNAMLSIFRRSYGIGHYRGLHLRSPDAAAAARLASLDAFLAGGIDDFELEDHVERWLTPREYPVMFVRYESLPRVWSTVREFVGIDRPVPCLEMHERASEWKSLPRAAAPAERDLRETRRPARRAPRRASHVIVTIVVSSVPLPFGGNIVCYELANTLRRRGHGANLVHVGPVTALDELAWFRFDPEISHTFHPAGPLDAAAYPDADFIVNPGAVGTDPNVRERSGLPLNLIQGHGAVPSAAQAGRWQRPWPKILIAKWLIEIARRMGVAEHQMVYMPPGIDHDRFRVRAPVDDRPLQVAMLYNLHPAKGPKFGVDVIHEVKRRVPESRAVLFGVFEMQHELPPDTEYLFDPPQEALVDHVYNGSRVFICSSVQEGFGLCSVEAMACGAALVTSATRGSDDFAVHGQTALVSAPNDVAAMADNVEMLLRDEPRRVALGETRRRPGREVRLGRERTHAGGVSRRVPARSVAIPKLTAVVP